jgi:uncharacterized protein YfdQ (DUF2303 family)
LTTDIVWAEYARAEGGAAALVGDLATQLAVAELDPILEGDGWKLLRDADGDIRLVEDPYRPRPRRATGSATLTDPDSFGAYVTRLKTPDTTLWADDRGRRIVALFNDHPAVEGQPTGTTDPLAGYRDHSATLQLVEHADWAAWKAWDGMDKLRPQQAFGEHIEDLAHTIVDPDSATMLEVALTLTARRSIDLDSGHRLGDGNVSFKFVEETTARAGRGASEIEIPERFTIACPTVEGGEPVRVEARLRWRGDQNGVRMGYRLLRVKDAEREAFGAVVATVADATELEEAIFNGLAPTRR